MPAMQMTMMRPLAPLAPLTASAAPTTGSGTGTGGGIIPAFPVGPFTCTAGGGSGSYSYAWTEVTHSPLSGSVVINNASTSACTVQIAGASVTTYTITVKCTVTDTVTGLTADSNNIVVTIERTS